MADEGLVHPSPEELASWRDILQNLAPLPHGRCQPTIWYNDRTQKNYPLCAHSPQILLWSDPSQQYGGRGYWMDPLTNQVLFAVFPGEQIGMSSEPELVEAATTVLTLLPPLDGVFPSNHGGNAW